MLIASLFITIISSASVIFSAEPKLLAQTHTALSLRNTIHALEDTKKIKQSTASDSAINIINERIRLAKYELLIEKCDSLPGISSLIVSFLLPCRIPALQLHQSDIFVRKGCEDCVSDQNIAYASITSEGIVLLHDHYDTEVSGTVPCRTTRSSAIYTPLTCNQLTELRKTTSVHHALVQFKGRRRSVNLARTYLYSGPLRATYTLTLNKHAYTKADTITWYQQCYNPQANHDPQAKSLCKSHFIVALAGPSLTAGSRLFVWSAKDGKFYKEHSIPPDLQLLAYKNPKLSILHTKGIDGFLWWQNLNDNTLLRLDHRGIWETNPITLDPQTVWYDLSPNAQWIIERLKTEGIQTTFSRTSCANAMLNASPMTPIHKQATLWNVTMACWLNTLFEDLNHSKSTIHMEPRWIVRYRNLRQWLATQNMPLIKGLQARISKQAALWVANRDKESLKSCKRRGTKRKHRQKACK